MSTAATTSDLLARCLLVSGAVSSDEVYLQARAPGRSPRHREVSVGVTPSSALEDRQRSRMSTESGTAHVLLSWQLSGARLADAATNPAGESAWLAFEYALRLSVLTMRTSGYDVRWTGTERSNGAKDWVYSDLSFFVIYPFTS